MKKKILQITLLLFLLLSCKKENTSGNTEIPIDDNFAKYNPEINKNFSFKNFAATESYLIGDLEVFVAKNKQNQKYVAPHLVVISSDKKLVFEGVGTDDLFQYIPHFFISKNKKQVIVCFQMAYEYNAGMDVFLIENNTIKSIGIIDVDLNDDDKSIADVTNIISKSNEIEFSFKTDSLVLSPGSEFPLTVANKIKYIYKNNKLEFTSSDPSIKFPKLEITTPIVDFKTEAESLFEIYISKIVKAEDSQIDIQETFVGDLTGDGIDDVIVFYATAPAGGNIVSNHRLSLFVNEKGKMKQYPDFETDYAFTVNGISNNYINITKYDFAETDEAGKPSLKVPVKIKVLENKSYVESK